MDAKHQVIVQAEAFSTQDHENLASVIAGAKKNMQSMGKDENYFRGRQLSADSNYHSYNNLSLCKAEGLDAYIPISNSASGMNALPNNTDSKMASILESGRPAKLLSSLPLISPSMHKKQNYLCTQGKALICHACNQRNRYRLYDIYHSCQEDCACCSVNSKWLSKPNTLFRYLSVRGGVGTQSDR